MAQDDETKSPAVETTEPVIDEQSKAGDLPSEVAPAAESEGKKDVIKELEKENMEKYPVEKSSENIDDNKVEVLANENEIKTSETRDFEPETTEKEKEPIGVEVCTSEPEIPAEIANKNIDEKVEPKEAVTEVETEKTISEPAVPADEIALMKDEKPVAVDEPISEEIPIVTEKLDKEVEPIKIEEPVTDAPKEPSTISTTEEAAENTKQETKEEKPTVETNEPAKEATETEKPALEPVKTESDTKEEEKTTPKSNNLFGKVKKSFIKAKKAITGKNNTNPSAPKTPEVKEAEKG